MSFLRSPSTFSSIAPGARADDVLPRCFATLATGNYMIESRFFGS